MTTEIRTAAQGSRDVKSALRVIEVLNLLGQWGGSRTHAQIAEELNIPKSSLTQVLKTLERHNYLAFDPDTRGYALGQAIDDLARSSGRKRELVSAAEPVLNWLSEETGESSALNVREGDDHRVAGTILSAHRIVAHLRLGDRAPLHATSGGQAILANLPELAREDYLARARYERYAANSLLNADAVRDKLAKITEQGFAEVNEEFTPGIGGFARPILDETGGPIASLSITVPVARMSPELRDTALRALEKAIKSLKHRAALN